MAREVTIDQTRVMQLMTDPTMVQLLSPLANLVRKKSSLPKTGCRPCGAKKQAQLKQEDKNQAVREIANLLTTNADLRALVKKKLGAETLRVKWRKTQQPGLGGSAVKIL